MNRTASVTAKAARKKRRRKVRMTSLSSVSGGQYQQMGDVREAHGQRLLDFFYKLEELSN